MLASVVWRVLNTKPMSSFALFDSLCYCCVLFSLSLLFVLLRWVIFSFHLVTKLAQANETNVCVYGVVVR